MKNFFRRSSEDNAKSSEDDSSPVEVPSPPSDESAPVTTKRTKPRLIRAVGEATSSIRKAMTSTPRNSGLMECLPGANSDDGHEKVYIHDRSFTSSADEDLHDEIPEDVEDTKKAQMKEMEMKQLKERIRVAESSVRDEARVVASAPSSPDRPSLFSPTGVPRFEGMESAPISLEEELSLGLRESPRLKRILQAHGETGRLSKSNHYTEDSLFASPSEQQIIFVKAPRIDPHQIMRTPTRPPDGVGDFFANDFDSLQGTLAEKSTTPSTVATETLDGSSVEDDDETRTTTRTSEDQSLADDRDPAEVSGPIEI